MGDLALSLNTLAVAYRDGPPVASGDGPLDGYRWPDLMREGCPCYGVFTTRDGQRIALANVEPKFWAAFLTVIDRPDLSSDRFSTGARARLVRAEIGSVLAAKDLDEWATVFADRDICGRLSTMFWARCAIPSTRRDRRPCAHTAVDGTCGFPWSVAALTYPTWFPA